MEDLYYAGGLRALHVTQANKGCDFDFLETAAGTPCEAHGAEPEIH